MPKLRSRINAEKVLKEMPEKERKAVMNEINRIITEKMKKVFDSQIASIYDALLEANFTQEETNGIVDIIYNEYGYSKKARKLWKEWVKRGKPMQDEVKW